MIYFMINLTVILKISFVIRYKLTRCIALTLPDDMKTVLKHSGLHTCIFTILFVSSNARRVLAYTVYKKTVAKHEQIQEHDNHLNKLNAGLDEFFYRNDVTCSFLPRSMELSIKLHTINVMMVYLIY